MLNAQRSKWGMFIFNRALSHKIAFNRPHKIRVLEIEKGKVRAKLPLIRVNTNHLGGLHACALATVAEFTSGLALLTLYEPEKYRLIMKKLESSYAYQGRTDVVASISLQKKNEEHIQEAFLEECEVKITDKNGELISTTNITWHIKPWEKVRLKNN